MTATLDTAARLRDTADTLASLRESLDPALWPTSPEWLELRRLIDGDGEPVHLRKSDGLSVDFGTIYGGDYSSSSSVRYGSVHVPIYTTRDGATSTGCVTIRLSVPSPDGRGHAYMSHRPTRWTDGGLTEYPDGACRLILAALLDRAAAHVNANLAALLETVRVHESYREAHRAVFAASSEVDRAAREVAR